MGRHIEMGLTGRMYTPMSNNADRISIEADLPPMRCL